MLNITNRTPLAGVKLFESSTYPADSIDLYWRDDAPIMFEISDNPDRGQMYQNFLARIQSCIQPLNVQYFEHQDHSIITAEFLHFKTHFWATVDYDVVTLHRTKPILPEEYEEKPEELSKLHVEVFAMNVEEALLATTFSPVDLAWLLGFWGNNLGFYEDEIWTAAIRRLPWITS
jgi:hypothetical protein